MNSSGPRSRRSNGSRNCCPDQLPKRSPTAPNEPRGQESQGLDRLQKQNELQQQQIEVLERQTRLSADQLQKQIPDVEKLQSQNATLEARSQQAGTA